MEIKTILIIALPLSTLAGYIVFQFCRTQVQITHYNHYARISGSHYVKTLSFLSNFKWPHGIRAGLISSLPLNLFKLG